MGTGAPGTLSMLPGSVVFWAWGGGEWPCSPLLVGSPFFSLVEEKACGPEDALVAGGGGGDPGVPVLVGAPLRQFERAWISLWLSPGCVPPGFSVFHDPFLVPSDLGEKGMEREPN